MNFTFPENKANIGGVLKNFSGLPNNNFKVSLCNILNPQDNIINIDSTEYVFTYMDIDTGHNKGGNSIILKLYESQNIDENNPQYDEPDKILKILKTKHKRRKSLIQKRFEMEIQAIKHCNERNFQNIIKLFEDGICKIYSPYNEMYEEYIYYTMEYAEYDLKSYVENNFENISLEQKISLCISLCRGLKELDSLGYYHRDIKPDNIFIVGKEWKIGDLGLLGKRDANFELDKIGQAIGPRGWMSPESMNKYLCEERNFPFNHSCEIDHQSDIFQLGKVFWYVFQHNAPIGSIKKSDFKIKHSRIYPIVRTMLNYSQNRRYSQIDEVIKLLKPIEDELLKTAV